jgi:hypothetical protein
MVRKVYETHLGFYDTVIAAPSQVSALAAWGSQQDLFRLGFAKLSKDPAAIRAALAKPGVVLRRPAGSSVPYREQPELPDIERVGRKRTSHDGDKTEAHGRSASRAAETRRTRRSEG